MMSDDYSDWAKIRDLEDKVAQLRARIKAEEQENEAEIAKLKARIKELEQENQFLKQMCKFYTNCKE